jgi:hypothetical protein
VDKRGPGRPKIGPVFELRLTPLQKLFVQVGAAVGNESVAAYLRRRINSDIRQLLEEAGNGEVEEGLGPRADNRVAER